VLVVPAVEPDQRALRERQLGALGLGVRREVARDDDQARRGVLHRGVLGQRRRELRELIPARRARRDQDREAARLDGFGDRRELDLAEAVVGTRVVLVEP
jgi:hypothetical protein